MIEKYKSKFFSITLIWFLTNTTCPANTINIMEFIESVSYTTNFTINSTPEIWNNIIDNPWLIGKLWEMGSYSPHYKVSKNGPLIHIIDPTGIEADLLELKSSDNAKIFYGTGNLNHPRVPFSVSGKAIIAFHYTFSQNRVVVTLQIHIKGNNEITTAALKALSPVLLKLIDTRVTSNVENLKKIILEINNNPDKIRSLVRGKK